MSVYLGLGSNQGDRRQNIATAIESLKQNGFRIGRVSAIVETPALLTEQASSAWNKPFINCVVEGGTTHSPHALLSIIQQIENQLGRKKSDKWSPRPIDIDILIWDDLTIDSDDLVIPHSAITDRAFVLTPLVHLCPDKVLGQSQTIFNLSQSVKPVPLWMGILNLTPDSFSDGGDWDDQQKLIERITHWRNENIQIIDIGAESTRPNAQVLDVKQEWQRLKPVLEIMQQQMQNQPLRPCLSLDSRNVDVVEKALAYGVDMINDVSGMHDVEMIALARDSGCQVVAMHSTSIPADPNNILSTDRCVVKQLQQWLDKRIDFWLDAGLDINKIIFDPGVGFGKTALQSLRIMQSLQQLRSHGLRLLVGHSRKSFMNTFTQHPFSQRDTETLGISLGLCEQGVDIIRVHDPLLHVRAYRSWSHIHHF